MALTTDKRKAWSQIRYQYYVSGRSDVIFQNFSAAGIMLGYAVETSYKQLLAELGVSGGIMNSHNTRKLHEYLVAHHAGNEPLVSKDFLDFVDDHLEARYPIQTEKVQARLQPQGRLYTFGLNSLSFYDDLLFQLENKILDQDTSDLGASMYLRGAADCQTFRGEIFFHGNFHAYQYRQWVERILTTHGGHPSELSVIKDHMLDLYHNRNFPIKAESVTDNAYTPNFSQNYVYLASTLNSSGQQTWTFTSVTQTLAINVN